MKTHLRAVDGCTPLCNTKSKAKTICTTATPVAADCSRCRKIAGLGKYSPWDAIRAITHIHLLRIENTL
jgi:hypothetical protein